jgi:hypothetical protein
LPWQMFTAVIIEPSKQFVAKVCAHGASTSKSLPPIKTHLD